jgi:PTS system nitrogen regulatory IIA component
MPVAVAPPSFDLSLCIPDLKSKKKDAALAEIAAAAALAGLASDAELLLEVLKLRERLGTTAIGKGVAIPHARSLTVTHARLLVARAPRGIEWNAPDDAPVQLVFAALAPSEWPEEAFHGLVARAASSARLQRNRQKLLAAPSLEGLAVAFREAIA